MSRVTKHFDGVISVDASQIPADNSTTDFLRGSSLYATMREEFGDNAAEQLINTQDLEEA
jgi:hypothetical protein